MKALIRYIIEEPETPSDQVKSCKFPMVASEFFTTDLPCVTEILFKEPELMRYLFSFVVGKGTLNFLLSGYFLKAYESCLAYNPDEFLLIIFQEGYYLDLISHLKSSSIAEIITSIVSSKPNHEEIHKIITEVVLLLSSSEYMASFNASQILCRLKQEEQPFKLLVEAENIEKLFEYLQKQETWVVRNAGNVLKYALGNSAEVVIPLIAGKVKSLADVLQKDTNCEIPTSFGAKITPFGEDRLMALDLFASFSNFPELHEEISNCLPGVLQLFEKFVWSSYFHNAFTILLENLLTSQSSLLILSLANSGFIQCLLAMAEDNLFDCGKFKTQIGSIGHVYKIINILINCKHAEVVGLIEAQENWPSFQEKLTNYNTVEEKSIGGGRKNMNFFDNMSSDDSSEKMEEPDLIPE